MQFLSQLRCQISDGNHLYSRPLGRSLPLPVKTLGLSYQAAKIEGKELDPAKILESFRALQSKHSMMLVEGIGGLLVPITSRYNVADLALQMGLPLIIVSRLRLGTLNHTLLTINAARQHGLEVKGVILNPSDEGELDAIEQEQGKLIEEFSDTPILGYCPFIEDVSAKGIENNLERLQEKFPTHHFSGSDLNS